MKLRLRCVCGHGYGTHELHPIGDTVQPGRCRAFACQCALYQRLRPAA